MGNHEKQKKRGDAYQEAVAEVAGTLYPDARIEIGQWVNGPDGLRELDVTVKPKDASEFLVIECKDWNRPIGIGNIDALESKRRDIGAKLVIICSNSGFTSEALHKSARVGIPALAVLIEGDKRVRVVVREQIYTRKIKFLSSKTVFHHQQLSEGNKVLLAAPLYTREYLFNGQAVEPWLAGKWMRLATAAIRSRDVNMRFRFFKPILISVRGIDLFVDTIETHADFTVQWMTQVAEIGASEGMYNYLRKHLVMGPGKHQFHLKNINTETWGKPVQTSEVPPRLLAPLEPRLKSGHVPTADEVLTLGLIEGLPGSDPKNAPDLDPLLSNEEITDALPVTIGKQVS